MVDDRIERELSGLRAEVAAMNATIAGLSVRLEAVTTLHETIDDVRRDLAKHETADAGVQAELQSEVRRLWWLVGFALTSGIGGAGTAVAAMLGAG